MNIIQIKIILIKKLMNYKTIYNKFNFIIKIYILKMNHIKKKIIKAKIYLNQKLMI